MKYLAPTLILYLVNIAPLISGTECCGEIWGQPAINPYRLCAGHEEGGWLPKGIFVYLYDHSGQYSLAQVPFQYINFSSMIF